MNRGNSVLAMVRGVAQANPDRPAVRFCGASTSFEELMLQVDCLAKNLRDRGVAAGSSIGVMLDKGPLAVIAPYAIWQVNAIYVPIDGSLPVKRLGHMLSQAKVALVVCARQTSELLPPTISTVFVEDIDWKPGAAPCRPMGENLADAVAYTIFTSGSTGVPKAVAVTQSSLLNLVRGLWDRIYSNRSLKTVSWFAPATFDASVKQLVTLAFGCCLVPIPDHLRLDVIGTSEYLSAHDVDVWDCTPTRLRQTLEQPGAPVPSIVLVGGETIDKVLWQRLLQDGATTYINLYGPTECTVDASVGPVTPDAPSGSIGEPLDGVDMYIVGADLSPLGDDTVGELLIAGGGVAAGYMQDPVETALRFIPNPFADGGGRAYRTGDLAMKIGKQFVIVGRSDRQLKVSGVRVDPAEIETVFEKVIGVSRAVTGVSKDGHLVAALLMKDGVRISEVRLRAALREELPELLIPKQIRQLDRLPETKNGKLDYEGTMSSDEKSMDAPNVDWDAKIIEIWSSVLGRDALDPHSNFFDAGGDSIALAKVFTRLNKLGVSLSLIELFRYPTARQLAARIRRG